MAADHPSPQDVALWVLDPASKELGTAERRHMEGGCPECVALADSMSDLLEEMLTAVQSDPPGSVLHRALSLSSAVREGDRILVAKLIRDTVELAGVRDPDAEDRFLLFRAGEYEIDVRIRTHPGGHRTDLRGQVYGPADEDLRDFEVQLTHKSRILKSSRTDDLGEFSFPTGPMPPFSLKLFRGPVKIHTPEISR